MRRPVRAPFVVTIAALGVGACSSSSPATNTTPNDARAGDDSSGFDAAPEAQSNRAAPVPLREFAEGTIGLRCDADATCDRNHSGDAFCPNDGWLSYGTLFPTPVCLGRICTPADDNSVAAACDEGHGICPGYGTFGGICLPRCTFDGSGAPPVGCAPNDPCSPYAWSTDATGAASGVGACIPGCLSDADCTGGDHCQTDQGSCVRDLIPRTFAVGDPCFSAANPPEVECDCLFAPGGGDGYCSSFCLVGDPRTTCPSGFVCSAALPGATFAKEPTGAAGNCLATCTGDADCLALNAICELTPEGELCVPGKRGGDAGDSGDSGDAAGE